MERRKLTKADIDKVRDIEGFPVGNDEDIIALSDAPYYTACPNPFIEEFIRENGTPYDEATDNYQREPFASDVSEGKGDAIYNAHTYHTKVPYKAIMRYILHYTNPGDVVYDGFCGTGMAGVAAQMCGSEDRTLEFEMTGEFSSQRWGVRKAILNDLSPVATFIAKNYTTPISVADFESEASRILEECFKECRWMWLTHHGEGAERQEAVINFVAWSDVMICPHCSGEIIFGKTAATKDGKIKDKFICPHCQMELKKGDYEKQKKICYDPRSQTTYSVAKQVPLVINYTYAGKRYEKEPDAEDLELIEKIENTVIPYWYPVDKLPDGYNTAQPIRSHGYDKVNLFYTNRILYFLAKLYDSIEKSQMKDSLTIWFTSQLINISKLNRYRPAVTFPYNPLSGTLYISSLTCESSPYIAYEGKIKKFVKALQVLSTRNSVISVNSTTDLRNVPNNSIDYIFTDPPFGGNLNYSELSFIWESWLKVKTNNKCEAIMNPVQQKGLPEYQQLMTDSFCEYFRILKPNRWMTVEFHNSKNAVWNAIQEGLQRAGFVVADVRTLDKQLGTFKQATSTSAVKQDLVISAYKPKDSFRREVIEKAGNAETAWSFVRQHLANVPVAVDADHNGKLDIIAERQAFLLFDRMVSYHIMQGIPVPLDSTDFYAGLEERFLKRDGMYFLPDQVNEYDMARSTMEVENIQFSLFVSDEKSAIGWLYQQLDENSGNGCQTYAELQPRFMQEVKAVDKREKMPELMEILEENFLKDDDGKWYIPDLTKSGDLSKLREKNLLKEFQSYLESNGKLKVFRSEAIRAGFSKLWKDKDYAAIVAVAERLPEQTIQEDPNLLMYYDISLSRV
jgi:hypothetical protein